MLRFSQDSEIATTFGLIAKTKDNNSSNLLRIDRAFKSKILGKLLLEVENLHFWGKIKCENF